MTSYYPKCFTGTKEPKKIFLDKQLGRDGKLYENISMRDSLYSPEKHLNFLKAKCKFSLLFQLKTEESFSLAV